MGSMIVYDSKINIQHDIVLNLVQVYMQPINCWATKAILFSRVLPELQPMGKQAQVVYLPYTLVWPIGLTYQSSKGKTSYQLSIMFGPKQYSGNWYHLIIPNFILQFCSNTFFFFTLIFSYLIHILSHKLLLPIIDYEININQT